MPILFRDYETRGTLHLSDVGAWRYATHPETDIWCCAFALDDEPVKQWVPGDPIPPEFIEASQNPDWLLSAFNDQFERLIEQHIMGPRYGWPTIPIERHRCLQASALSVALPASLEAVALALGLDRQKDMAGHKNMLAMAKPRKPCKDEDPAGIYWHNAPARLEELYRYARQDIEAERALHARVGFIPPAEQAIWELDAAINNRGIFIDNALALGAIEIDKAAHDALDAELQEITSGEVTSINQTEKLSAWLSAHGCPVDNLQKRTLDHAFARKAIPQKARRVLELRRDGAHAAASKFKTLIGWRAGDGHVRGAFRYHGASTGRWASVGIQLHNLKKPTAPIFDATIEAVKTGDLAHLLELYPQPLAIVGDVARAALCASPGHRLINADFSAVESRVTAWLAGERSKLDQWAQFDRTGNLEDEPYYVLGAGFKLPAEQARAKGKTADLLISP